MAIPKYGIIGAAVYYGYRICYRKWNYNEYILLQGNKIRHP